MASTSNTSSVDVSLEELDNLRDIIDDIFSIVTGSNLNLTELNRVDQLIVMVMQQMIKQLQAADAINVTMVSINQSEIMLLEQLKVIKEILARTLNDLNLVQLELMANGSTNLNSQVQRSLNRSLLAYEIITNDVLLTVAMITNKFKAYDIKLRSFLSIKDQISNFSSLIDDVTAFATKINSFLCGENVSLTDTNCSGVVQVSITTASQITASIMEMNEYLSTVASVEFQLKETMEMLNHSLHVLKMIGKNELPTKVMTLRDDLLNLTEKLSNEIDSTVLLSLESLINQSLQLSLISTPDEVCMLIIISSLCVCSVCVCVRP